MMRLKETDDVFGANGWCVWSKQTIRFAPARRCMILWIHYLCHYTHCTKPFTAFIRNACAKISDGSYARKVNIYSYDSVSIYQAMD